MLRPFFFFFNLHFLPLSRYFGEPIRHISIIGNKAAIAKCVFFSIAVSCGRGFYTSVDGVRQESSFPARLKRADYLLALCINRELSRVRIFENPKAVSGAIASWCIISKLALL